MRISDWSSDVCSSDLAPRHFADVGLAADDARIDGEFVAAAARQYVAAAQARFQPPRDGDDEFVAGQRPDMLVDPAEPRQVEQQYRMLGKFLALDAHLDQFLEPGADRKSTRLNSSH